MEQKQINKALQALKNASSKETRELSTINYTPINPITETKAFSLQAINYSVKDVAEIALNYKPSSLLKLTKEYGGRRTIDAICLRIIEVLEWFNVKRSMNEAQIELAAQMIYSDFKHFNMYDIVVCFRGGMRGQYGKVLDRIDGSVLFEWLVKYDIDRTGNIVTIRQNQDNEHKKHFRERTSEQTLRDYMRQK